MPFSDRLKALRIQKHLTQEELSKATGITKSAIGMYESGKREPKFETLEVFADYFNVSIDDLLGRAAPHGGYYLNDETAEIANALKEGDGMLRVMFDAARNLPPEKMKEAASYIEYLKARQHPEEE